MPTDLHARWLRSVAKAEEFVEMFCELVERGSLLELMLMLLLLLLNVAELTEALEAAELPPVLVLPPESSGIVEGRLATRTAAGLALSRSLNDFLKIDLVEESEAAVPDS